MNAEEEVSSSSALALFNWKEVGGASPELLTCHRLSIQISMWVLFVEHYRNMPYISARQYRKVQEALLNRIGNF